MKVEDAGRIDEGADERDRAALAELVAGCLDALDEEIAAVREELARRGLDRTIIAEAGIHAGGSGPGFRYDFDLGDQRVDIRPDDGVRVSTRSAEVLGFVLGYDRRTGRLRISVPEWLGRHPGATELEFDPTWLLTAVATRLEALDDRPDRFHPETVLRLFGRSYPTLGEEPPTRPRSDELNDEQQRAVSRILGSDVHFVWGPPGTGKTLMLGHAVAELAERGTVLVASATNAAVDEAARRVAEALGPQAIQANRLIRIGAEYSVTGAPELSLASAVARRVAGGAGRIDRDLAELEDELGLARGADARERLARIGRMVRAQDDDAMIRTVTRLAGELQKQAVLALREADVVLTTLARLAVRDELAVLRFDAFVLDEASTAPLPHVALAAAMTRRRAVAIGDFQQLPAVVISRGPAARRWLGRDVFREAGIVAERSPDEIPVPGRHDRLCAMLTEQYRMSPPVRSLVSELFYDGRLVDAPEVVVRRMPTHPLVLVDTTSLEPRVERLEGSRANDAHLEAMVSILQASAAVGVDDVAVISPYRLQARKAWKLARGRLGRAAPRRLEISTVHRYQGREKALVIFDTVDAPPGASWFLNEGRNPDFPRLLNVALSRTREMLIIIGTRDGLRTTLPEEALLNRAIEQVARDGLVIEGARLRDAVGGLFGQVGPPALDRISPDRAF